MLERRTLGRTGIEVGAIGLGTEHLERDAKQMDAVLGAAVHGGVNYVDLLYVDPRGADASFWEPFAPALQSHRGGLVLAAHWGGGPRFDIPYSRRCFEDLLAITGGYAEVALMTMVDDEAKWSGWAQESLEYLRGYREQGRVGSVGVSSHVVPIAKAMVESGSIDVLMFSVNPVWDAFYEGVSELYQACAANEVGLVGMKPFNGGTLLVLDGHPTGITPVQCLAYALSLPVAVTLPGPKNEEEMRAALHFLSATDDEKECDVLVDALLDVFAGHCVYCDHCLPCPEEIEIGSVLRLGDWARGGVSDELREWYGRFDRRASDCVACGECMERCPFGVDVIAKMEQAAQVFEA